MSKEMDLLHAMAIAIYENKKNIELLMKHQGLTPIREIEPEVEQKVPPEKIELTCMSEEAKMNLIARLREQGHDDEYIRTMLLSFK